VVVHLQITGWQIALVALNRSALSLPFALKYNDGAAMTDIQAITVPSRP
jgi:hypothetical protein